MVQKPKTFRWDEEKNKWLKAERGISFEQALVHILNGDILDVTEHPNKAKYPNQRIFVIKMQEYAWLIPFVETTEDYFLKTIIPSRKATRKYLRGKANE